MSEKMIDPKGTKECNEHRLRLNLPDVSTTDANMQCRDRFCYDNCPVVIKEKKAIAPKKADKPKKQKEISKEVEDFLWMQSSVMSKLAWHPEIWKALYKLNADEILERLVGKTGLEAVPTIAGGKMQFEASKQTKKMFADLENKFAEEDEKSGKNSIHDGQITLGDGEYSMEWRDDDEPHGYFEKGVWKEPKEGKKNGKKNKDVAKKT